VKLYARGHLSEEELDLHLADLKNTADNLKLLLEAADAELAESRQRVEAVEDVEAWLLALRERAWWRSRRISRRLTSCAASLCGYSWAE
jgi:hypothetical protein